MNEKRLELTVGLFVLVALAILAGMILVFGDFDSLWTSHYTVAVHFPEAPGIMAGVPVKMSGVTIGSVQEVRFDQQRGGVTVVVAVQQRYTLRRDCRVRLSRGLLGDAFIEFAPGVSPEPLPPGSVLDGVVAPDPMRVVRDVQRSLDQTLRSFQATSQEWRRVAQNVNSLLETNHGRLDLVMQRAADALAQLTETLQTANQTLAAANQVLSDPQSQQNLRKTLEALPQLASETHQTIAMARQTLELLNQNLRNLTRATTPLAERGEQIAVKLDRSLDNIQQVSANLRDFSEAMAREDGSLKRFATDPQLYRNLNRSAEALAVLLKNLEPVVEDLRVFSDKIARHPELIGVAGALKGSSGLKSADEDELRETRRPLEKLFLRR